MTGGDHWCTMVQWSWTRAEHSTQHTTDSHFLHHTTSHHDWDTVMSVCAVCWPRPLHWYYKIQSSSYYLPSISLTSVRPLCVSDCPQWAEPVPHPTHNDTMRHGDNVQGQNIIGEEIMSGLKWYNHNSSWISCQVQLSMMLWWRMISVITHH